MDLIIKPTELCNFACTFCSSTDLVDDKASKLPLEKVFEFLKRFPETNTIIVNGGDPLIMSPEYYWEILSYLNSNNLKTTLSFTTNLWDFYKKPDKWTDLFKQKNVGVSTSFNYGTTRRISRDQVFSEEIFWKISDLFLLKVGYRPDFLSVINDENEDTAIDNVRLAKRMGVECKLNYAMSSGRETRPYQLSKIYKIYLEIIHQGLAEWEFNTKEMVKGISHQSTICPRNRDCDSGIRCLQPDGDYYSCGAFGDDKQYPIDFVSEMQSSVKITPLQNEPDLLALKPECLGCMMFSLCNGCKKTVSDLKNAEMVESHCHLMKKLEVAICELPERFGLINKSKYGHEARYSTVY